MELHEMEPAARADWAPLLAGRLAELRLIDEYLEPEAARREADRRVAKSLPDSQVFEVREDGARVGHVWWRVRSEEAGVLDLRLDEPGRVAELLPALVDLGREAGASSLGVAALPRCASRTALAALPGFGSVATNMRLLLDRPVPEPSVVLRAMSEEEFSRIGATMIEEFAAELAHAGMTEEGALEESRRQHAELIPDGLDTEGQHFFIAESVANDESVGMLWLSTQRPAAFVYQVEVWEAHRRKGYGAGIMNAGARWCQDRDIAALGLNVFAHNPAARALYDRLGYDVTEDFRSLDLTGAG